MTRIKRRWRRLLAAVASIAIAVGGLSCGSESNGTSDAPIARTEHDPWVIMAAPDGYPNIAHRCFGTTGLFVARGTGRPIEAVVADPGCAP